jgi:hypothetical protein
MWGYGVDERKLQREDTNRPKNQWHNETRNGTHPTEAVEGEGDGTWGEGDVGGFTTRQAMEDYEVSNFNPLLALEIILTMGRPLERISHSSPKRAREIHNAH